MGQLATVAYPDSGLIALLVWLALVLLGDLGLMGTAVALTLAAGDRPRAEPASGPTETGRFRRPGETMMRLSDSTTLAAAALLLAAGVLAACGGGGGGPAASPSVAQGENLYQKTCATCHGADGHGMPKLGKDLHDNAFTKSLSDDELVEFLLKGRPAWDPLNERGVAMPPKGGNPALTEQDLRLIVAFLRTLQ